MNMYSLNIYEYIHFDLLLDICTVEENSFILYISKVFVFSYLYQKIHKYWTPIYGIGLFWKNIFYIILYYILLYFILYIFSLIHDTILYVYNAIIIWQSNEKLLTRIFIS